MICDLRLGESERARGRTTGDEGLGDGGEGLGEKGRGGGVGAGVAWWVVGGAEGRPEGRRGAGLLSPVGLAGFEKLLGGEVFELGESLLGEEDVKEMGQLGRVERLDIVGLH